MDLNIAKMQFGIILKSMWFKLKIINIQKVSDLFICYSIVEYSCESIEQKEFTLNKISAILKNKELKQI